MVEDLYKRLSNLNEKNIHKSIDILKNVEEEYGMYGGKDEWMWIAGLSGNKILIKFLLNKSKYFYNYIGIALVGACDKCHKRLSKWILDKFTIEEDDLLMAFEKSLNSGCVNHDVYNLIVKRNIQIDWSSMLYQASSHMDSVKFLLDKRENNYMDVNRGLYGAATACNTDVLMLMFKLGASDLHGAVQSSQCPEITRLLVEMGASKDSLRYRLDRFDMEMYPDIYHMNYIQALILDRLPIIKQYHAKMSKDTLEKSNFLQRIYERQNLEKTMTDFPTELKNLSLSYIMPYWQQD